MRPVVAHFHHCYLARSETFIYRVIAAQRAFHPIVLARKLENLELFPLPAADLYDLSLSRNLATRAWESALRRVLGIDIRARRILRRRGARLIHAHFGWSGVQAMPLARALGLPLVTTFYGHDVSIHAMLARLAGAYRELFAAGDLFLVEGPHMRGRLVELGCPESKLRIQRIAIALDQIPFKPRHAPGPGEPLRLLFCGRFVPKKGVLDLLRAFASVAPRHPRLELRLVGEGPERPAIEAFITRHGLGARVALAGFAGYAAYLSELERAHLFIHPSVTAPDGDSEGGAPTTILEAQASGLPVLATQHADIPNVVVPGASALLTSEGDWQGLAENLERLIERPEDWEAFGKAGRAFVTAHHDIARELGRLEDAYRAVLAASQR